MKKCFECEATEDLQEHHVVPRSRGVTKTVTLFNSCHQKAHGRDGNGLNHSRLTKEGLERARKKALAEGRVWKVGNPNWHKSHCLPKAHEVNRKQGKATAMKHGPKIEILKNEGYSFTQIAKDFNEFKIPTPNKGKWHPQSVINVYKRYLKEKNEET